jgi:D-alanyl-D-alanine carboxypeptidase (penicillin-binding protein 5/6)
MKPQRTLAVALAAVLVLLLGSGRAVGRVAASVPQLTVSGASLIDADSGRRLYGLHADAQLPIASTTKLMTALITLERVRDLSTVFAQNNWRPAPADSQIGLTPGERMSVRDLLIALMLPSADDAAEDLAYNVGGGSVARFVAMMNTEARRLGLKHTHYTTPIGLDTPGNYSSPDDLDRLAAYEMARSPFLRRVVAMPSALLRTGGYVRTVINRNDLVGRIPWITGVKTGHTLDAGYVLVASGRRDGMSLVASVLGTSSESQRDHNALALLDWGFANFLPVAPIQRGQLMARRPVEDQSRRALLVAATGVRRIVRRTDRVRVLVRAPRQLTGPLPRGAAVGAAVVEVGGRPVARVPLVLQRALPAVSPLTKAARFLTRPSTLMWLALAVGLILAYALRRRPRALAGGRMEEG